MKSPQAHKLIESILNDVEKNGVEPEKLVEKLKELRPYAVEEKQPVIAKAIRLTFEHLETHKTFDIPIPDDEPVDDPEVDFEMQEEVETETARVKPAESLIYLVSLMKDPKNRLNLQEIREYNQALADYAEE